MARRWWIGVVLALLVAFAAPAALAPAAPATRAAPAGHPGVLVVGDSLEELASPYLTRYLPGVKLTVNAVGGSNSYEIYDLFRESYDPSQSVIVFDAGTNDNPAYPQILAGNLAKVAATVGNRCLVVPTIHGFTVNGVDNAGKNRVVREFAASRPGTQVPDWAGFVNSHPELLQPDGLHPIAAGAEQRARLIAAGVEACLGWRHRQAAAREPILAAAPAPIAPVSRLAERRQEIVDATLTSLVARFAATALTSLLLGTGTGTTTS